MPFFRLGKPKNAKRPTPIVSEAAPALPVVSIASAGTVTEGDGGTVAATFTLTRTGSLTGTSSVLVTISGNGGNPASAADFGGAFPSGTVSFAPGDVAKSFVVSISGDADIEASESFKAVLSDAVNCTIGNGTATGTITNDDTAPEPEEPVAIGGLDAPIGAGGFLVTFDIHPSTGTMAQGHDVGSGALLRAADDERWNWAFTPTSIPEAEIEPGGPGISNDGYGCAAIKFAPSDANTLYALWRSGLWKTEDGGDNWTRTPVGEFYVLPNTSQSRLHNDLLSVHPTNPDVVIWGTNHYASDTSKSGVFYTLDGGASKAKISSLPAASSRYGQPGRCFTAFDPAQPSIVYAFVQGSGVHRSNEGATGTFSLIGGSPTNCDHMFVTADGTLWMATAEIAGGGVNDIYKRTRAGSATTYSTGMTSGAITLAVNPANANHVVAMDQDGPVNISFDGAATWEQFRTWNGNLVRGSGEVAWLSDLGAGSVFPAKCMFDPLVANKLWVAHGTGVASVNVPTAPGGTFTFNDASNGIEEKVAESFLSIPGTSRPILGNWDYSIWPMDSLSAWTNVGIIPPLVDGNGLAIAKRLDYAADDADFLVCAIAQANRSNAFSADGGDTWGTIPGQVDHGFASTIACNTKQQIIVLDTNNGKGHWTANGGTDWDTIKLDGVSDSTRFANAQYVRRHSLSADKTRSGVFALVHTHLNASETAYDDPLGGLWLTTNSGAAWTKKINGLIGAGLGSADERQFWQCELQYVPGFTGELLYTSHADFTGDYLLWLQDDGETVERLGSTVTDVTSFSFGPIADGQTRPSVGFYGKVSGTPGLYITGDWFATAPTLISRYPMTNLSNVNVVGCDRNILGRVFAGGIGWRYWDAEL